MKCNWLRHGRWALFLGAVCLLTAIIWLGIQCYQEYRAGVQAQKLLTAVLQQPQYETVDTTLTQEREQEVSPVLLEHVYGVLDIPDLEICLPVLDVWNYETLKISPCRYSGQANDDNLVILGHNYAGHFAALEFAQAGQKVCLCLSDGTEIMYLIDGIRQILPTETEAVSQSGYPLTIFTCTRGGQNRWAIYCVRE